MAADTPKIFPLGDGALVVEFGREISVELNGKAIALANYLDANPFAGYIESVPAYASTAVFYDTGRVRSELSSGKSAFETLVKLLEPIIERLDKTSEAETRRLKIPISFEKEDALDLAVISKNAKLAQHEVIEIFTSVEYRVFMLGFLPGFTYMGLVDPRIAMPRKETPRVKTPKGSVGIAVQQTGIYPFDSPGGWQIIGRTTVEMFDPASETPCLLRPGDVIRFVPT